MNEFWVEVIKQAPALGIFAFLVVTFLGVVLVIVNRFLRHIREMSNDFKSTIEEANVMMADQNTLFRERTEKALDRNTHALAQNTLVVQQFNHIAANGPVCGNFRPIILKEKA